VAFLEKPHQASDKDLAAKVRGRAVGCASWFWKHKMLTMHAYLLACVSWAVNGYTRRLAKTLAAVGCHTGACMLGTVDVAHEQVCWMSSAPCADVVCRVC
jgi:hypothetical protein